MKDIQPTIDIIQAIKSLPESKILQFISITSMNSVITIKLVHIISQHTYNLVTKPLSGPIFECKFSYIRGVRFYPSEDHDHFSKLDIHLHIVPWSLFKKTCCQQHLTLILSCYQFIIIFQSFLFIYHVINISKKASKWTQSLCLVTGYCLICFSPKLSLVLFHSCFQWTRANWYFTFWKSNSEKRK